MKNSIKIGTLLLGLIITTTVSSQQTSLYSQYFLQEHIINPATTGSRTYNPLYLSYRNQWSGFNGGPETVSIGGHYALDRKNGIGGMLFNDAQGGAYTQTGGQLNYAHHLQIKEKGFLSFGAGVLFDQFRGDYTSLLALDANDPAIQVGNESKLVTDISTGVQLNMSGLRLGVSALNLLEAGISDNGALPEDNRLKRQFNLLTSYRAEFDSSFVLEPILMYRTIGSTGQLDATVLGHISDKIILGLSYRSGAALTGIAGLTFNNFLISYSYDMATTSAQNYVGNTHEIVIGYRPNGKGGQISGDKDLDGVADADDRCPEEAGPKENNGCPYADSDGDGIPDNIDKCPQLKGEPALAGCPDRDKDGIPDLMDECPDLAGSPKNGGCPEFSQLHVLDNKGRTVTVIKEAENGEYVVNGISHKSKYYFLLETNKEEIPNPIYITIVNEEGEHRYEARLGDSGYYELVKQPGEDNIEEVAEEEVVEVVLEEEQRKVVDEAFGALEFENGKSIIKESSYPSLLELVKLLDNNADWKVSFTGHTDNVGEAMFNMLLSKKRAEAVKEFLNQFGVDDNRIVVDFYGETKPISTNDTEEGRSRNRRVDMVLIH